MRFTFSLAPGDQERWNEMWSGLSGLAELSAREAGIIADVARRNIASHFAHERSPEGHPWVPLAPMTQAERKAGIDYRGIPFRTGASHPIMVRTKDLKLSFTDAAHPRNITDLSVSGGMTFISLGAEDDPDTPNRIATLHAGGTAYGMAAGARMTANEVPARPFIGLSDSGLTQLYEQTTRVLQQRLERI